MSLVAVAVVVAAGVAIGGAVIKGDAARKAANARKDALGNMELINLGKEQEIALSADQARIKNQLALQDSADPRVGKMRDQSAKGIVDTLYSDQDIQAEVLGSKLYEETFDDTEGLQKLKETLIEEAQADLDRGAELPPEFQAELVRSGLQSAGESGFLANSKGAAGRSVRGYLGAAGLALKEQRRAAAVSSGAAVSSMNETRASILGRVIPTLQQITDSRARRAGLAFNTAEAAMPEAGLSGAESVNLDLARIAQQNKKVLGLGEAEREKRIAQGEMWSSILSSAGSAVGGLMGGGGGGMGSIMGMMGGTGKGASTAGAYGSMGGYGAWGPADSRT